MKIKTLLSIVIYILLCHYHTVTAQTATDSLRSALDKERSDTAKVSIQGALMKEYIKAGQMNEARQVLQQMLLLADKTNNNLYKALANNLGSYLYYHDRNFDSTFFFVNKTLDFLKSEKSRRAIHIKITANNNLAAAYSTIGKIEESIAILIANLDLIRQIDDKDLYHLTIHNISAGFVSMSRNDKAYEYMLQDVELADKPGSSLRLQVLAYLNATAVCYNLEKFPEQKQYLQQSFGALKRFGNNTLWAQYYAYEAMYYAGTKQPVQALAAANRALIEAKKYKERSGEYLAYEAIRDAESAMKHYSKARAAAQRIYEMGVEDGYTEAVIDALKSMAKFSAAGNDYKAAYTYLHQYDHLKDSAQSEENTQKMNELETRLRTAQKEEKITRLELDKKKTSLKIKNQQVTNIFLGVACLLLTTTLGLGYLFFRNNKRIAAQKEKVKVSEAMFTTQEEERSRIANDLHDGLGGALSGIKINLSSLAEDMPDAATKAELEKISLQLGNSIVELRNISHNMTPGMLETLGLQASLQDLCQVLRVSAINVHEEFINISKAIPRQKQIVIYRIVQELFANILKHAGAAYVFFQCSQQGQTFFITVEDDGKGFDSKRQYTGMGLKSIRNRVSFFNGSIDIVPEPDQRGTAINIQLDVT